MVTKDVPDFAKIIGNPGKVVGWVDKRGNNLVFDKNGYSQCRNYVIKDKLVKET